MSCMIMKEESLAALANAVADRLNRGYDFWGFEAPESLYHELSDCRTVSGCNYSAEAIYHRFYTLNVQAYNGRYKEQDSNDERIPNVDISH